MSKNRIGVRVREAVGVKRTNNRSTDLVSVIGRYHVWCKRIRSMIVALQQHAVSMLAIEKTRKDVSCCSQSCW